MTSVRLHVTAKEH